jgi:hypothetical protein
MFDSKLKKNLDRAGNLEVVARRGGLDAVGFMPSARPSG